MGRSAAAAASLIVRRLPSAVWTVNSAAVAERVTPSQCSRSAPAR